LSFLLAFLLGLTFALCPTIASMEDCGSTTNVVVAACLIAVVATTEFTLLLAIKTFSTPCGRSFQIPQPTGSRPAIYALPPPGLHNAAFLIPLRI
jgi:hypothetical protein